MDTFCETCGVELRVGDFPFCPHGAGRAGISRDEIPGGVVVENYGPKPIRFDSHSERRKYMAEHGLQEREKFAPMPGTDKDPAGIPNPAGYMDRTTLENARILIERASKGRAEKKFDVESVMTIETGDMTTEEAIRVQSLARS